MNAKRVFVTATSFQGGFGSYYTADALTNADKRCAEDAGYGGLGSTWTAWISTATTNAIDRIVEQPYYLIDKTTLVIDGKQAIATASDQSNVLLHAITIDEHGDTTTGAVWTGSDYKGHVKLSPDGSSGCFGWTTNSAAYSGNAGTIGDVTWTWGDGAAPTCNGFAHLYCFEN